MSVPRASYQQPKNVLSSQDYTVDFSKQEALNNSVGNIQISGVYGLQEDPKSRLNDTAPIIKSHAYATSDMKNTT